MFRKALWILTQITLLTSGRMKTKAEGITVVSQHPSGSYCLCFSLIPSLLHVGFSCQWGKIAAMTDGMWRPASAAPCYSAESHPPAVPARDLRWPLAAPPLHRIRVNSRCLHESCCWHQDWCWGKSFGIELFPANWGEQKIPFCLILSHLCSPAQACFLFWCYFGKKKKCTQELASLFLLLSIFECWTFWQQ